MELMCLLFIHLASISSSKKQPNDNNIVLLFSFFQGIIFAKKRDLSLERDWVKFKHQLSHCLIVLDLGKVTWLFLASVPHLLSMESDMFYTGWM